MWHFICLAVLETLTFWTFKCQILAISANEKWILQDIFQLLKDWRTSSDFTFKSVYITCTNVSHSQEKGQGCSVIKWVAVNEWKGKLLVKGNILVPP